MIELTPHIFYGHTERLYNFKQIIDKQAESLNIFKLLHEIIINEKKEKFRGKKEAKRGKLWKQGEYKFMMIAVFMTL
jgi:hypothetical protein